jgi:NAD(P)-dependent dehydrogenase (short-subunit alcohol dehydrogenase family)
MRVPYLDKNVCIITGGAGSIGLAIARVFVREGGRVMLVDSSDERLAAAAAILPSDAVATLKADVRSAADAARYVAATVDRFGPIDVLVSNAGTVGPIAPIAAYPDDAFDEVLAVHVKGAFLACKFGIPAMNDGGRIVIVSSVAGLRADPGPYGYVTAKHAQVGLMRAVAKEVAARRIRVNTIHPGPVDNAFQADVERELSNVLQRNATDFFDERIPLGRHATPEEVADSVLYLASSLSSFTTGSTLVVDGGMST